jgi:hypothetical protein
VLRLENSSVAMVVTRESVSDIVCLTCARKREDLGPLFVRRRQAGSTLLLMNLSMVLSDKSAIGFLMWYERIPEDRS